MAEKRLIECDQALRISGDFYFIVDDNTHVRKIDSDTVKAFLSSVGWSNITDKPFVTIDSNQFTTISNQLKINGYHIHTNQTDVLDKLSVDGGNLLFDDELIGTTINNWAESTTYTINDLVIYTNNLYQCTTAHTSDTTFDSTKWQIIGSTNYTLPTMSTTEKGGAKIDGDTISIDANDVISVNNIKVNTLEDILLEGNNITLTSNTENNTISLAVNGHTMSMYANNTPYIVGDVVIYETNIFQRITTGTDTAWTPSNWNSLTEGVAGADAYVWIKYSENQPTQDSDISDTPNAWIGIYNGTESTPPTAYASYTWFKFKGENGENGITPTIDSTTKHWMLGTIDTNIVAEGADGNDGNDGNDGFSPIITENADNNSTTYKLDITTATGTITTPNLKGADGSGGGSTATITGTLTLLATGWDNTLKTQMVAVTLDTNKYNKIIITLGEADMWGECEIEPIIEASAGITFKCSSIPSTNLTFTVLSMEVTANA